MKDKQLGDRTEGYLITAKLLGLPRCPPPPTRLNGARRRLQKCLICNDKFTQINTGEQHRRFRYGEIKVHYICHRWATDERDEGPSGST